MQLIGLLVGALILMLFMYIWLDNPFSQASRVENYQQVNRDLERTQEISDEYKEIMNNYETEINQQIEQIR